MGAYGPGGCKWFSLSGAASTATNYPSDGAGGRTTTAASSQAVNNKRTRVFGILLTATAAGNIVLRDHAGTALAGHTIAVGAGTVVPQFIPLGGADGFDFATGISANVSASGIDCSIYYDRVD